MFQVVIRLIWSLGTNFKVVIDITFISKMGDKVQKRVIRRDKMQQDVKTV